MIYCFSPSIFTILDEISIYSQGHAAAADGNGARIDIDYHTRNGGVLSKTKAYKLLNKQNSNIINNNNGIINDNITLIGSVPGYIAQIGIENEYDSSEDGDFNDNYIDPDIDSANPNLMENKINERKQKIQEKNEIRQRKSSMGDALQSIDDIDDVNDVNDVNDDQSLAHCANSTTKIESQMNMLYSLGN